ncbi:hypothetical protein JYT53_01170 [Cytophagaceae bacterium AH-315-L13]|nr:hypothetical protein [Cytophagaceae bacterium AH-315-L13]
MKKNLITITIALMCGNLYAQINMADSTVQVVGYWVNNETKSYEISYDKFKIKNSDTTSYSTIKYEVDIAIKDSTANGFVIEWFYNNYKIETENPIAKKLSEIANDMAVLIRTDEFGAVQEVVNWEEVRDYILKATNVLKKELVQIPNIDQILSQVTGIYTSKEAIQGHAIKDALQFYTYHGGKYTLGEKLASQLQMPNIYGGNPFDIELKVSLDEINEADDNSIIRMSQSVNSEQLTDATYGYLQKLGTLGDKMPKREDFPPLTNVTWTESKIDGASGWIIYSKQIKKVMAEGTTNVEVRIIKVK